MVSRLIFRLVLDLQVADLGDRVDQPVDLFAEDGGEFLIADIAVFDDIMKKTAADGLRVCLQGSEDIGDRKDMRKIGISAAAELSLMFLMRIVVSFSDQREGFLAFDIGLYLIKKLLFGYYLPFFQSLPL